MMSIDYEWQRHITKTVHGKSDLSILAHQAGQRMTDQGPEPAAWERYHKTAFPDFYHGKLSITEQRRIRGAFFAGYCGHPHP